MTNLLNTFELYCVSTLKLGAPRSFFTNRRAAGRFARQEAKRLQCTFYVVKASTRNPISLVAEEYPLQYVYAANYHLGKVVGKWAL